jgi:hypothetical protein
MVTELLVGVTITGTQGFQVRRPECRVGIGMVGDFRTGVDGAVGLGASNREDETNLRRSGRAVIVSL